MSMFLTEPDFPYCNGCGHHLIARNTVRALEALGHDPLDVVLVTDIGCHGIVDRSFATHTIHGLHGRSVALGSGIAMGARPDKEIIVFVGDGGATIGLQHLLEAARLNVDLTVVVHNNMLYGMTGGQPSGLTPCGFRTSITREESPYRHYDLCQLVHDAGAPYARRILGLGDFSTALQEAFEVEGFALVEVLEMCTSYALKMNPNLRLRKLAQEAGYEPHLLKGEARCALRLAPQDTRASLLRAGEIKRIDARFTTSFQGRLALVVSGSAGEGVQRAAELFAEAAIACGLDVAKKGSYPVTVGVGFSSAEVIVSRGRIVHHGVTEPDYVVITSENGLAFSLERVETMKRGTVWVDKSLETPKTGVEVRECDFRAQAGPKNATIVGLLTFVQDTDVIPPAALVAAIRESSIRQYVPENLLEAFESA